MKKPNIALIAAMSQNRVIGKDNSLPWYIPGELAYFAALTKGHVVIMGRKTFESLGLKPLSHRINIVITSQKNLKNNSEIKLANSLEEALKIGLKYEKNGEICIIGGGQIYHQALKYANIIRLTQVHQQIEGDTFFPEFEKDFDIKNELTYSLVTYTRKG